MRAVSVDVVQADRRPTRKPDVRAGIAATVTCAAICVGATACTPPYGVNAFAPDKLEICPGETTTLHWDVTGPARLKAQRSATDWDTQVVPSSGLRACR
jgi:hypothetical protein